MPARWLLLLALSVLLVACGEMQPGSQPRNARELQPGAGLFSGAAGEFVLIRPSTAETQDQEEQRDDASR